jgi:hypothetical protein
MLQVLETLLLMCILIYFQHISLHILNCIYKKFKKEKIPCSFLPSLFDIKSFKMPNSTNVSLTNSDMVLAYGYGAAGGNAVQAQILYREQFPDKVVPNSKTFTSTVQRLRETGNFHPRSFPAGG